MATFEDWELHNAPFVDEDGEVEAVLHKWESYEIRNAQKFIAEFQSRFDTIPSDKRGSAELELHTRTDYDGYPEGFLTLSYRRPATEKEILMDKARQRKSVMDDRIWLENKIATMIAEAREAGLSANDLGICVDDGSYTIVWKSEGVEDE
jgi:hypothetical protein